MLLKREPIYLNVVISEVLPEQFTWFFLNLSSLWKMSHSMTSIPKVDLLISSILLLLDILSCPFSYLRYQPCVSELCTNC